jgi:two-component sensor histidine kinase
VGLIINELITNSIKHAFPDGKSGKIEIKFKKMDSHYSLMVKDDGVGLPEDMEFDKSPNLGIKIINALVDQLDGDIKVARNHGTCVLITFKDVYYYPKDSPED